MNFFDIVFSAIFVFSIGSAIKNGPSRVFITSIFLTAGFIAAENLYNRYFEYLLGYVNHIETTKVFSYLVIFIGILLSGTFLKRIYNQFSEKYQRNGVKSFLAVLFGLYNGAVFFLVIHFVINGFIPSFKDDLDASFYMEGYQYLKKIFNGIKLA